MMVRYCHFGVSPVNYSDSELFLLYENLHFAKKQPSFRRPSFCAKYLFLLIQNIISIRFSLNLYCLMYKMTLEAVKCR